MSRSLKKGPYLNHKLIEKAQRIGQGGKTVIKTWDRGASISPEMVGVRFGIHDGRKQIEVLIVEDMVGHKLGEFAPTRKFIKHGGRLSREEGQATLAKEAQGAKAAPGQEVKEVLAKGQSASGGKKEGEK